MREAVVWGRGWGGVHYIFCLTDVLIEKGEERRGGGQWDGGGEKGPWGVLIVLHDRGGKCEGGRGGG